MNASSETEKDYLLLFSAVSIVACVVVWGLISASSLGAAAGSALQFTTRSFGGFYLWVVLGAVLLCLFLAMSRYGNLRLGTDDEEPEFSNFAWFGMLFAAGMG